MKFRILAIGAMALSLAACGAQNTPRTAPQGAYALESTYVGVLKAANDYAALPRCSATQVQPCSDQAIVNRMADSSDKADAAVKAAVSTSRNTSAGQSDIDKANVAAKNAVSALQAIVDTTH